MVETFLPYVFGNLTDLKFDIKLNPSLPYVIIEHPNAGREKKHF